MSRPSVRRLYLIGAIASLLQLATIGLYIIIIIIFGPRITSAGEFYTFQQSHGWVVLFRVDLLMLILIGLYLGNFPGLFIALWRDNPIITLYASLFTLIAVILCFAGESTFALKHLGEMYATATSEAAQSQLLSAGEAILAGGWWHSTGSYVTGILLQSGGIMLSFAMLQHSGFSKITGIAGIVGNGFDLMQHLAAPFAPQISEYLSFAMVAYLIWYPMMARDLYRLAGHQAVKK